MLHIDSGIPTDKLDKGCIIFNTDRDEDLRYAISIIATGIKKPNIGVKIFDDYSCKG